MHRALRAGGLLLIFQPARAGKYMEVQIGDEPRFRDQAADLEFGHTLEVTREAMTAVVEGGLFAVAEEMITPGRDAYDSLDDWLGDRDLDDPMASDATKETARLVTRLRRRIRESDHKIWALRQEYSVLMRRV